MATNAVFNHSERLAILKAARTEQMGLNCALKCLNATKDFKKLCLADSLNPEVFKSGAAFIEFIKTKLPETFNAEGALCRFVKDKEASEKSGETVTKLIPRTTYSPYSVYTLARKANKASKK